MAIQSVITEKSYRPGTAMLPEPLTGIAFFDPDELVVELGTDDSPYRSALVRDTHYTIDGDPLLGNATITALAEYEASEIFHIRRETPRLQRTALPPHQPLPADDVETSLDKLALVDQEQDRELGRRPSFPRGSATFDFADLDDFSVGAVLTVAGGEIRQLDHSGFAGKFAAFNGAGILQGVAGSFPAGVPAQALYIASDLGLSVEDVLDGSANLRGTLSAAQLEARAAVAGKLTLYAGQEMKVSAAPYLRGRFAIDGNGGTWRNNNTTPLTTNDHVQVALPLGSSTYLGRDALTYRTIASAEGNRVNLAVSGEGALFAVGDPVVLEGATHYSAGAYRVWRNNEAAVVRAKDGDTLYLSRPLSPQLIADTPRIGNLADEVSSGLATGQPLYFAIEPTVCNLTLKSDFGEAIKWGGIIGGHFANLIFDSRNGIVLNAMHGTRWTNIRVRGYRKALEIAEGSTGVLVDGLVATLESSVARGDPLTPNFFAAIHENSAECRVRNFYINSGPNDPSTGNSAHLGAGRANGYEHGIFVFPGSTNNGIAFTSNAAGGENTDCFYHDVDVYHSGTTFFAMGGLTTIQRPRMTDCRFHGTVSVRAGNIAGTGGKFTGNTWPDGVIELTAGLTDTDVIGNHIEDGFSNLTPALMAANRIHSNTSAASKRLDAASKRVRAQTSYTGAGATTPYKVHDSASWAEGDLRLYDEILIDAPARTEGGSGANRNGRLTLTVDGTEHVIASVAQTAAAKEVGFKGSLWFTADTVVMWELLAGGTLVSGSATIANLATSEGTVEVEYWLDNAADGIVARQFFCVFAKQGMRRLPMSF